MTRKRPQVSLGALNADQTRPSLLSGFTGVSDVPVVFLPLSQIHPRTTQPRRSFGGEGLQRLTDSVRIHGVIQPLTVHETASGYQLVAGERRWRAAQAAGLSEVPVRVLKTLTELELKQFSAVENLQREDLNAVDEADAVLDILEAQLGIPRAALTPRLERLKSIKMRDPNLERATSGDCEMLAQVEQAFQGLGRGAWTSFVSNRLPVLRLPEDLLGEVRGGTLEYTKAVALRSVSEDRREGLIQFARQASLSELRARLRQNTPQVAAPTGDPERLRSLIGRLESGAWETLSVSERSRAERLLTELNTLLAVAD